jgi:hypothetical protein
MNIKWLAADMAEVRVKVRVRRVGIFTGGNGGNGEMGKKDSVISSVLSVSSCAIRHHASASL